MEVAAALGQSSSETSAATFAETFATKPILNFESQYGAQLVLDVQYDLESSAERADTVDVEGGLALICDLLSVREAHRMTRGAGSTVAIVDTGIDGDLAGIGADRRAGGFAGTEGDDPWEDFDGHGSLTARIACGADGIAPESATLSCRTRFYDSELAAIYDYLTLDILPTLPGALIIKNSFGIRVEPLRKLTPTVISCPRFNALNAGIFVVFSAGNYHLRAKGRRTNVTRHRFGSTSV